MSYDVLMTPGVARNIAKTLTEAADEAERDKKFVYPIKPPDQMIGTDPVTGETELIFIKVAEGYE